MPPLFSKTFGMQFVFTPETLSVISKSDRSFSQIAPIQLISQQEVLDVN